MFARQPRTVRLGLALLLAMVLFGGCGHDARKRQPIVVASAKTPEQLVLGQLTAQLLQAHGYDVVDRVAFGDAWAVRRALEAGTVDLMWAYTADAWREYLGHDHHISDPGELYRKVRDEDQWQGITWLPPAPCERTAGLVMSAALAREYGILTIDELGTTLRNANPDLTLCAPASLYHGLGGVSGLLRVYGLSFARENMLEREIEDAYPDLLSGDCDCAFGYTDDVAIIGDALVMLRDNRGFFQASSLALSARTTIVQEFPELPQILATLSQELNDLAMGELYQEVAVKGREPRRVAKRFLADRGLFGRRRRILDVQP